MSARCAHSIVKDGAHGDAHHARRLGGVSPLRSACEDVVEHGQHVLVVPDLALARRIPVVRGPTRDLVPHLAEVHVDAGVTLDQVLELLQDRNQLFGIGVDVVHLLLQPLAVQPVVRREPGAGSDGVSARPGSTVMGQLTCRAYAHPGCCARLRVARPFCRHSLKSCLVILMNGSANLGRLFNVRKDTARVQSMCFSSETRP